MAVEQSVNLLERLLAAYVEYGNTGLALLLYWLPMALCVFGYTLRTWSNYRKDVATRARGGFYSPTDTVGTLIGRGVASVVPVANLLAAVFDVAPQLFGRFFRAISHVFNQPLVPRRDQGKQP